MKILVIGSGGREHAIVWKIAQSPRVKKIYCAPGNPGTAKLAENVNIPADDIENLKVFVLKNRIDLTVVGPEIPLVAGIVDSFEAQGLKIFGPTKAAAILEGSKVFSKNFMKKYNIPTAFYEAFSSAEKAKEFIKSTKGSLVVKADGLAAGKGVLICHDRQSAIDAVEAVLVKREFGEAGNEVIIEEFLEGVEASIMVLCDGKNVLPLASARDHKQVFNNNKGPNTGGMGAYSPSPIITESILLDTINSIILPAVNGMAAEGRLYKGVLYAGIMINNAKPMTLEFNCRLGDPETQPVLMRMKSDIIPLFEAVISGSLEKEKIEWSSDAAACIVMASEGYPGAYSKGKRISGLENISESNDLAVFHSGTLLKDETIVTSGGRVLGVTARGKDIFSALKKGYEVTKAIHWEGVHYRTDIGLS